MLAIHLCQTAAVKFSLYVKGDSSQEGKKKNVYFAVTQQNAYAIATVHDEYLVKMQKNITFVSGNHKQKTYSD